MGVDILGVGKMRVDEHVLKGLSITIAIISSSLHNVHHPFFHLSLTVWNSNLEILSEI